MGPQSQNMRERNCGCRQQALAGQEWEEGAGLLSVGKAQTSLRV